MRLAFSGTQKFDPSPGSDHVRCFHEVLMAFYAEEPEEVITGLAEGLDLYALRRTRELWPDTRQTVFVPGWPDSRSTLPLALADEVIYLPDERDKATAMRRRNEAMVERCDELLAFPWGLESSDVRSGTWMTVRIARKKLVSVRAVVLEP